MRIGIDIDDTITNTWDEIIPYYSVFFNIPMEELKKEKPYYNPVKYHYTKDEYFKRINPIYDNVTPYISLKKNVQKVINDLHNKGHNIIFISNRGKGYTDPLSLTQEYLKKNNINYDKLFIDVGNKATVCLNEKIDIFIDDSYKHCMETSKAGINTIMMESNYNKECRGFKRLSAWDEIYKYIEDR